MAPQPGRRRLPGGRCNWARKKTAAQSLLQQSLPWQLRSVGWSGQALTFGYDASGQRLGYNDSVELGICYTLRGLFGQVLREYYERSGSWSWVKDRVWAGGELLATVEPSGIKHLHRDHLGSVRVETGSNGALLTTHSYWPFGEEMTVTSSSERYRFAGHERDQRTGYDYMHARYYAPMAGRFFSVDPGRDYDFSHPQSFNLYAYVRNNPVTAVDRNGKEFSIFVGWESTNVPTKTQILVAAHIAAAFRRAGVKDVSVYWLGGSIRPPLFSKTGDSAVVLRFTNADLGKGLFGLTMPLRQPGQSASVTSKAEVSVAPATEAGLSGERLFNYLVNVGAHEAGHGSGAFPQYNQDAAGWGSGERGTLMQGPVQSIVEWAAKLLDFSKEDAEALAKHLVKVTDQTNPATGETQK